MLSTVQIGVQTVRNCSSLTLQAGFRLTGVGSRLTRATLEKKLFRNQISKVEEVDNPGQGGRRALVKGRAIRWGTLASIKVRLYCASRCEVWAGSMQGFRKPANLLVWFLAACACLPSCALQPAGFQKRGWQGDVSGAELSNESSQASRVVDSAASLGPGA